MPVYKISLAIKLILKPHEVTFQTWNLSLKLLDRNLPTYLFICINRYAFISCLPAYLYNLYCATLTLIERNSGKAMSAFIPTGKPLS